MDFASISAFLRVTVFYAVFGMISITMRASYIRLSETVILCGKFISIAWQKQSFLIPAPALIHIIPILALRTAKYRARTACLKYSVTVLTDTKRIFIVRKHKAEHCLYCKRQRLKIPNKRRLVEQRYMIARRNTVKTRHSLSVKLLCCVVEFVKVLII